MAGYISEFFGYAAEDNSDVAVRAAQERYCAILGSKCEKLLHSVDDGPAGVCAIRPMTSEPVICCPIRLYANQYQVLADVAKIAFGRALTLVPGRQAVPRALESQIEVVAVFGKKWGGELRVPKKSGLGGYWVDWILALVDTTGELVEFVAVEVQTIDTTGNYRKGRTALLTDRSLVKTTAGFNWENVNKRILPQLIYKGQLLQREDLCRKGLFFIAPSAVYQEILRRVGGEAALTEYPLQPASITFLTYDTVPAVEMGTIGALEKTGQRSTTVYKLQEAFNNVTLTETNVYQSAILDGLGIAEAPNLGLWS